MFLVYPSLHVSIHHVLYTPYTQSELMAVWYIIMLFLNLLSFRSLAWRLKTSRLLSFTLWSCSTAVILVKR